MNTKIGITITAGVAVVAGAGILLGFNAQPITPEHSLNTRETVRGEESHYQHKELGLSFKSLAGTQIGEFQNHIQVEVPTDGRLTMYFRKIQPEAELSPEEIVQIEYEAKNSQGQASEPPQPISFGDRQGYGFFYHANGSHSVAYVAFPLANEEVLLISYVLREPFTSASKQTADRILSSLEEI